MGDPKPEAEDAGPSSSSPIEQDRTGQDRARQRSPSLTSLHLSHHLAYPSIAWGKAKQGKAKALLLVLNSVVGFSPPSNSWGGVPDSYSLSFRFFIFPVKQLRSLLPRSCKCVA